MKIDFQSTYFVRSCCGLPLCKVRGRVTPWPDVIPEREQGSFVKLNKIRERKQFVKFNEHFIKDYTSFYTL
jgi:hypothetical protein